MMAVGVAVVAGYWQVFAKAGRKGWESLVPGWNLVVLTKIVGRPWWWSLGLLFGAISLVAGNWMVAQMQSRLFWLPTLPGVGVFLWVHWRVSFDLAKSFRRGPHFGWRLTLLPFVYIPVLGFGYTEYSGPAATRESREARRKRRIQEELEATAAYAEKQAAKRLAEESAKG